MPTGDDSKVMSLLQCLLWPCFGDNMFASSVLAEGPLIKKGDYAHFRYFVLDTTGMLKYYEISLRQTINASGDVVFHIPSTKLTLTNQLSNRNLRGTMMLHPSFCARDLESPQGTSSTTRDFRSASSASNTPGSDMRCFRRSKEIHVTGFSPTGAIISWKLQASSIEHYDKWTRAFRIAMRPTWLPNSPFCQICRTNFQFFSPSRHCRKCGTCVCQSCSHMIDKLPLLAYTTPVPICIDCDPVPDSFDPQTKVLVYGMFPAIIVASVPPSSLTVEYLGRQSSAPTTVSVKYVERYSEMVLAANRIKCCLRAHVAYRLFRTQLHFHTWSLLETLQEQQTVKIVKIIRNTISVNELASLAPSYEERNDAAIDLDESLKQYRGVHLNFPLTENQVLKLSDSFRGGIALHGHYVTQLLDEVLARPPRGTMTHIQIPKGIELLIVGDLHGQYEDLMTIFDRKGVPSKTLWYLFNGDFVDRGLHGVEVICTLLAYSLLYPQFVFLNRGNHEASVLNRVFGFNEELKKKYPDFPNLFDKFEAVFNRLPLCTLIQDSVLVVHGGLPCEPNVTLKDIQAIDHLREIPTNRLESREDQIFSELMWNDPQPMDGKTASKRGCGFECGPDITRHFCALNNLRLVIRSHESHEEGFEVMHDGLILSVFSASSYCGFQTNKGAYVVLTDELKPYVVQFHSQALQKFTSTRNWRTQANRFEERTLWSLRELIGKKHSELGAYFHTKPPQVSRLELKQGLVKVLGIPLYFLLYFHQLLPKNQRLVDTTKFLKANQLVLPTDHRWVDSTMQRIWSAMQETNVTKAFDYFDRSRKGRISFEDLKATLRVLGLMKPELPPSSPPLAPVLSQEDMAAFVNDQMAFELMHRWDTNQDGIVDMQEFQLAFSKQLNNE
ncbi:unnamed protein product [Aphanomyces euteiches]